MTDFLPSTQMCLSRKLAGQLKLQLHAILHHLLFFTASVGINKL